MTTDLRSQYTFNNNANRYINIETGRFVSTREVNEAIERQIESGFNDLDALLSAALDPRTPYDLNEFYEAMRLQLKILHVQVGVIGAGGVNNATSSTYGKIGNVLKQEYKFAQAFVNSVANGELTERQIRARLGMYANKIWYSYNLTKHEVAVESGFTEERRVLSALADSCGDCVNYARQGWQLIGTLPLPTQNSVCMSNCRCRMEYR